MSGKKICVVVLLLVLVTMGSTVGCWAFRVGLVRADNNLTYFVSNYLMGTGLFESVTNVDAKDSTPTLAQLQAYDGVMVWSNPAFADATTLGNNLADYVDGGGGVVIASWADSLSPLSGKIMTNTAYAPCEIGTAISGNRTLVVSDPASPILTGVTSVGGYYEAAVAIRYGVGAHRVAEWNDGNEFVVTNQTGKVVMITMYPGENTLGDGMTGDYARLYANALISTNPTANTGIQGTITLSNFGGDLSLEPIRIELIPQGGGTTFTREVILTDNPGLYSVRGADPGTYNVRFSANKCLRKIESSITVSTGSLAPCDTTLVNGDLDGSNSINSTDLSVLLMNIDQQGD